MLNIGFSVFFHDFHGHRFGLRIPQTAAKGDVAPATRRGGGVVGCLQRSLEAQLVLYWAEFKTSVSRWLQEIIPPNVLGMNPILYRLVVCNVHLTFFLQWGTNKSELTHIFRGVGSTINQILSWKHVLKQVFCQNTISRHFLQTL